MYGQLQHFRVSPEFETVPTAAYACPEELKLRGAQPFYSPRDRSTPEGFNSALAPTAVEVPKLLKTYLAIGARIAAPPAWDREFRSIDFLTLLDLKILSAAARSRFLAPLIQ